MTDDLDAEISAYIDAEWERLVADVDALVRIPSVEDRASARPGAPFGPEPARALATALGMARRLGFAVQDCEGFIGIADAAGASGRQIGIIGHVDVVPAGSGWTVSPYEVTRKDGFLIGRGVADDKGPLVAALYAAAFWMRRCASRDEVLPHALRILVGANEETDMGDVDYYRRHFPDPEFLFTPDAEFPVGYGEAGICSGVLESGPIRDGRILSIEGGVAVNAVPGQARAILAWPGGVTDELPHGSAGIEVRVEGDTIVIEAQGRAAHASTPELGVNAIGLLAAYLIEADLVAPQERPFLELVWAAAEHPDGSALGVRATDAHFGSLTSVAGVLSSQMVEDGQGRALRMRLSLDFRYPTTISSRLIEGQVDGLARGVGGSFSIDHDKEPFLMDADAAPVQALIGAYNHVTGEQARPFTMKGGTYARMFSCAASFGPEFPDESKPAWVGAMHGPDEGISEQSLKRALAIYIHAIGNLLSCA